jgi:hypothetical protein
MPEITDKTLDATLVKCMSVRDVKVLAEICASDPRVLKLIAERAMKGDETHAAKASWVLSKSAELYKADMKPFADRIIKHLASPLRSGIKRELLKALLFSDIHKSSDMRLLDILLALPFSNDDVGVKYIALRHLERYAKFQPELRQEIVSTLELSRSLNPPLWSVHAKRLIDRIEKKGKTTRKRMGLK